MSPRRYVIVGGSAAGMAAAQAIRELDGEGSITVLSAEADRPYFRPLIPFLVDGKKRAEEMALEGQGPYTAQDIEVRLSAEVTAVNPADRTVTVKGTEAVPYDRLLIATGSRPNLPPSLRGTEVPGVFALRTLADARLMAQRASITQDAVLIGGGMLNLKTAFALLERGVRVTMVVASPEVLSQIMEPEGAALVRDALTRAGLRVLTGRNVTQILSGPNGVAGVLLDTGERLACQMVCIGKGVRPNVGFLAGSGVRVDGGVVVDDRTATNVPDVYAAGDVAVTFDSITSAPIVTALWTNAVEMGRCAGRNMAGRPTAYAGTFGILNATQVAEVPFVSMGIVHTAGKGLETHVVRTGHSYRKMVFGGANGATRLVGVVLVGDISRAGLYRQMIRERMPVQPLKDHVIEHRLHYGHFLKL
ncbi:MAG: NAD(P)/FAD-dependent oxidoreductase [Sphingomonadaceae bacterium]